MEIGNTVVGVDDEGPAVQEEKALMVDAMPDGEGEGEVSTMPDGEPVEGEKWGKSIGIRIASARPMTRAETTAEHPDFANSLGWDVTLYFGAKRFAVKFYRDYPPMKVESGHAPPNESPPSVIEVLGSLLADFMGISVSLEYKDPFVVWCDLVEQSPDKNPEMRALFTKGRRLLSRFKSTVGGNDDVLSDLLNDPSGWLLWNVAEDAPSGPEDLAVLHLLEKVENEIADFLLEEDAEEVVSDPEDDADDAADAADAAAIEEAALAAGLAEVEADEAPSVAVSPLGAADYNEEWQAE